MTLMTGESSASSSAVALPAARLGPFEQREAARKHGGYDAEDKGGHDTCAYPEQGKQHGVPELRRAHKLKEPLDDRQGSREQQRAADSCGEQLPEREPEQYSKQRLDWL